MLLPQLTGSGANAALGNAGAAVRKAPKRSGVTPFYLCINALYCDEGAFTQANRLR
jgi:hypothetical protein